MGKSPTKEEIMTAVAVDFRDDLPFLEELNSLSWSLKVRLKANLKSRNEQRLD
jgi:hypothetical protein